MMIEIEDEIGIRHPTSEHVELLDGSSESQKFNNINTQNTKHTPHHLSPVHERAKQSYIPDQPK